MKLAEYQQFTREGLATDIDKKDRLPYFALGLSGEVGELNNMLTKKHFRKKLIPMDDIVSEIGDVMWYLTNVCNALDVDLVTVCTMNQIKLHARHSDKYVKENE